MAKHALVEQPTARPAAKVTAAGLGAAFAALVLILTDVSNAADLPTWADTIITGVSAFAAGYIKKARVTDA